MPKYSFPLSSRREARVTTIVLIVTFVLIMILAAVSGCTPKRIPENTNIPISETIITTDTVKAYHFKTNDVSIYIAAFELHGHIYLCKSGQSAIIHAAHCPCKNTR